MNDGLGFFVFFIIIIVGGFGFGIGYNTAWVNWEKETVAHGCGFYKPDGKPGEFVWK